MQRLFSVHVAREANVLQHPVVDGANLTRPMEGRNVYATDDVRGGFVDGGVFLALIDQTAHGAYSLLDTSVATAHRKRLHIHSRAANHFQVDHVVPFQAASALASEWDGPGRHAPASTKPPTRQWARRKTSVK